MTDYDKIDPLYQYELDLLKRESQRRQDKVIMIIIMSLFYEDYIFSTTTNLTYGPRLKDKHENHKTIFTVYT